MIDVADITEMLKDLAKAIPRGAPEFQDNTTAKVWAKHFVDFNIEVLTDAFERAPVAFQFFPSLRELVLYAQGCDADDESTAAEGARAIWRYMFEGQELTPFAALVFDDMGGWDKLGKMVDQEQPGSWLKAFREGARAYLRRMDAGGLRNDAREAVKLGHQGVSTEGDGCSITWDEEHRLTAQLDALVDDDHFLEGDEYLEPYEVRKRKAFDAGLNYWEPPRSHEINRPLTHAERQLWTHKINQAMRVAINSMKRRASEYASN